MNTVSNASATLMAFTPLRLRITSVLAIFALFVSVIGIFTTLAIGAMNTSGVIISIVHVAGCTGAFYLVRLQKTQLATGLLFLTCTIATFTIPEALVFNAALATIAAGLIANPLVYWVGTLFLCGEMIARAFAAASSRSAGEAFNFEFITIMFSLMVVSISVRFLVNRFEGAARAAQGSVQLLQAAAEIGQILGKLLTLKDVLPRAVELVRERFGFYHVQVFLVDESGKDAELVVSTGAVGQQLVARHHSLPVGSQSVIGRATANGQPVIARDTDAGYYRNELLPNTRSELALPIFDGDKIIGALDVQSREYEVFGDEVTQALQVVANQLGTTIRNARLFENQEKSAREAQRLFRESENNLLEIRRLNQQLTHVGWQEYLGSHKQVNGITINDEQTVMDSQWTEGLLKAGQIRQAVVEKRGGGGVIAVPMMLGDEVIGAIEIEADNNMQQSEITEMVNAVAQRLALSLDKARLFEESQEAAASEQHINQIVARFQTVNTVDDLLQITLEEVSQSLGAKSGFISLSSAAPVSANGEGQA
jgi:GAF domain-containing protein